jgi:hypothetical protein
VEFTFKVAAAAGLPAGALAKGDNDHDDQGDYPLVKDKLASSPSL